METNSENLLNDIVRDEVPIKKKCKRNKKNSSALTLS